MQDFADIKRNGKWQYQADRLYDGCCWSNKVFPFPSSFFLDFLLSNATLCLPKGVCEVVSKITCSIL